MAILIGCSGFFSASEAVLFCLRWSDRRLLAGGSRSQRAAEQLLMDPDRLLAAVLFWNLLVNVAYFAISSIVGLRLQRALGTADALVLEFASCSLLSLIFFSEMLPKSLAVLQPLGLAGYVGIPLAAAVRVLDPVMPAMRSITQLSRRLVTPRLMIESPLELDDIGRAIEYSTADRELLVQEQMVLDNIISMTTTTASEWMRPRKQVRSLAAPISLHDLRQLSVQDEYVLVRAPQGDDIVAAIPLRELHELPAQRLEKSAQPVAVVPWCAPLSAVLEAFQHTGSEVTVIVNEHGETIGVITLEDIWDAIFTPTPTRGQRLLEREPIVEVGQDALLVNGITNLSTLERRWQIELPNAAHATIAGVVQEQLERLPVVGDRCVWGPLDIEVVENDAPSGLSLLIKKRELPDEHLT